MGKGKWETHPSISHSQLPNIHFPGAPPMSKDTSLADLRKSYEQGSLDDADLAGEPLAQFGAWLAEALDKGLPEPNAMTVATVGEDGPHMVNTWNSYVRLTDDGRMLIPAGFMHRTEANIRFNPDVLITCGSSKVQGKIGPGTGFLIKGSAEFRESGADFDRMKATFGWMRAVVIVTIESATQTL